MSKKVDEWKEVAFNLTMKIARLEAENETLKEEVRANRVLKMRQKDHSDYGDLDNVAG